MSYLHTAKVWQIEGIDPPSKLVLLKLADCANDKDECWPSLATISRETGLSKSTVCDKLKYLTLVKIISRLDGPRQSTIYQLHLENVTIIVTPNLSASRTSPPPGLVCQPDTTSPPAGQDLSASRTPLVRQPDTNHNRTIIEPSLNHHIQESAEKPKASRGKKTKQLQPTFDENFPDGHRQHLELWFRYKAERNEAYTPIGWSVLCNQQAKRTEQEIARDVEFSISKNYSGIFSPRQDHNGHKPKHQAYQGGSSVTAGLTPEEIGGPW